MTLKFRKVQRKVLSGDDKDKVKTYAMARSSNYCDMDKLCELISSRSAMSSADVKAILDSLNWAMSLELRSGSIVQVGEFGSFRLSIRSKGAETADAFNASLIKKARVIFSPGTRLYVISSQVKFLLILSFILYRFNFIRIIHPKQSSGKCAGFPESHQHTIMNLPFRSNPETGEKKNNPAHYEQDCHYQLNSQSFFHTFPFPLSIK